MGAISGAGRASPLKHIVRPCGPVCAAKDDPPGTSPDLGRTSTIASIHGVARQTAQRGYMTPERPHAKPILVTGAAGIAKGHRVRALVRREDERAEALRELGAEVMQGDLTDLTAMHRAIEGCARVYFGMSVSTDYLTATINTAAVALNHGVEAFVNMSQMTVTQMSITETTNSPQHKLHWLAEQALSWSGLPVITMRPTVFLEGFFLLLAAPGVRDADELALPMGGGKTSPISAVDVARARTSVRFTI